MGFFTLGKASRVLADQPSAGTLRLKLALQSGIAISTLLAASLSSSVALASGEAKDKSSANAGSGPSTSAGDSPGGGAKDISVDQIKDRATDTTPAAAKIWEVGVGVEYHHTGLDGGYINNELLRNVNYYSAYARVDPSPYDRISLSMGLYQYFISDQGESGVRADDLALKYTRRIPLPADTDLRLSGILQFPTSYGAQLAGIYIHPGLQAQLDKRFGRYFTLDGRVSGSFWIVKFAEGGSSYNGGGNSGFGVGGLGDNGGGATANPKGAMTLSLNADLAMPFHERLSVGLTLYTGYTWYYDVSNGANCPAGTPSAPCANGTTMQPTSQPFTQSYADEIYVRYALPSLGGFKIDLSAVYAPDGDGTLGYASVLAGNGAAHVYPFYSRENAEVYFAVNGRY